MAEKLSRRQFLSLMGYSSFFLVGAMLGLNTFLARKDDFQANGRTNLLPKASAASAGSWTLGPDTLSIAIHAALLYNGKVLYVAGSSNNSKKAAGPFKAGLLDPSTGNQREIILSEDLFCCGQCMLDDGNVLFGGGTKAYRNNTTEKRWQGLECGYVFDVPSESFVKVSSMAHGRWYPTLVTLQNGEVFTNSGLDEFGCMNDLTEIYNSDNDLWTIKYDPKSSMTYCVGHCSNLPGAGSPCYGGPNNGTNPPIDMYPRMHLLPNGLVASCGQVKALRTWNPVTGEWRFHGEMITGPRNYGTTILLPLQNVSTGKGRILVAGGSQEEAGPATDKCEIVSYDSNNRLTTRATTSMHHPRKYPNPVILPDGKVLVVGGTTQGNIVDNAVYAPEMFNPATEEWTVLPSATVPRMYHSVALLLPDGRVWTASTSYSASSSELRTEIFSPSYISEIRPVINKPPIINETSNTIKIPTKDPTSVASVSLVRVSSTTHHFNTDQRLLWLPILRITEFSVIVRGPINPKLAPPGYYLLHIINSAGIPSEGKFLKIR